MKQFFCKWTAQSTYHLSKTFQTDSPKQIPNSQQDNLTVVGIKPESNNQDINDNNNNFEAIWLSLAFNLNEILVLIYVKKIMKSFIS